MIRKNQIIWVLFFVVLICGCSTSKSDNTESSLSSLLSSQDLQKMTTEKNLMGKVTIIDFWATWCPPCKKQIPVLVKLQSKYKSKGLQIIGISLDETPPRVADPKNAVETMIKRLEVNYKVGIAGADLLNKFPPIRSIPTAVIYNRQGKIVKTLIGFNDEETLDAILKELF
ncbi:MAG: hypothetical protein A2161_19555 [Candidatus Schekmanbacteria bacterium RBG_13_48_7]|uniref:Thioredoxin domain-containing protein n=1 Tax=Candidatus Schekmanbacteria bacterium RBG_13_48_7 TaxID=1817878 RepID=A0A1F7S249_9BACT|nr:MAG: hypothetical protein A2161_19555 [Candidatus Schekmanbacteria bacterium RBG_13_48_7]